jgi:Putative sensor
MAAMDSTLTPERSRPALLRPLMATRGWTAVTHHLLGLPLGIAYFTWIVTGLAAGAGLAITLVGLPILTLVLASVRPLLAAERTLSNTLLGTERAWPSSRSAWRRSWRPAGSPRAWPRCRAPLPAGHEVAPELRRRRHRAQTSRTTGAPRTRRPR